MKARAKNLTLNECIKLLDWLRENVSTLNGLSFSAVGLLASSENILERQTITKDQIERVAKEGGVLWELPQTHITPGQFLSIVEDLTGRIEVLEAQVKYMMENEHFNSNA